MNKKSNRITGINGEKIATEYLQKIGYNILTINFVFDRTEIDIIAEKEGLIVFVEVKSRSTNFYGFPEEAVNEAKQENIQKVAEYYLEENKLENEIRFDVISLTWNKEKNYSIYHIEDAF
jgi:putative endonuclease